MNVKKVLTIAIQILSICLFFICVNWIVTFFSIPIPSSVLGMIILSVLLVTDLLPLHWVEEGSLMLIRFMPIMFVPDGVALFHSLGIIQNKEIAFLVMFVLSTILVMGLTGLTSVLIQKGKSSHINEQDEDQTYLKG